MSGRCAQGSLGVDTSERVAREKVSAPALGARLPANSMRRPRALQASGAMSQPGIVTSATQMIIRNRTITQQLKGSEANPAD